MEYKIVKTDKPVWVIGDVHGMFDKLTKLLEKIPKDDIVCFVGDLIDRGSKSKEVIDLIMQNKNYYSVKGNHEEMPFWNDEQMWYINGGAETVSSFDGVTEKEWKRYLKWMNKLPIFIRFDINGIKKPLYVSHSVLKLRPTIEEILKDNDEEKVLWRKKHSIESVDFAINIYGHIITPINEFKRNKSYYCIDNGGYKQLKENSPTGRICAIKYPNLKIIYHNED